jgi:hypothetical protein
VAPVQGRVDDDLTAQPRVIHARPNLRYNTGTVGSGNDGKSKTGVGTLFDPDVPVVQGRGVKAHDGFAGGGMRIGDGIKTELLDASEDGSFHG